MNMALFFVPVYRQTVNYTGAWISIKKRQAVLKHHLPLHIKTMIVYRMTDV